MQKVSMRRAWSRAYQNSGDNINIFPNISGTIVDIPVHEDQWVPKGTVLGTF